MTDFPDIHRYPYFAYDTETTGLDWPRSSVFGFSISLPDGRDFYYDIRQTPRAWEWWGDQVRRYRGRIICHYASFDYNQTKCSHVTIPKDSLDCTSIRACLIDEHLFSYDLDSLGQKYLGTGKFDIVPELQKIFGGRGTKNVQMRNLPDAPPELVGPYAKRDTRVTLDLWEWQQAEIQRQRIEDVIEFERSLMPTIIGVEEHGIRVDTIAAERACFEITQQINPLQKRLNDLAGFDVNVNSNSGQDSHIPRLFRPKWDAAGGVWRAFDNTPLPTTPGGRASLAAEALLAIQAPEAKLVLEIRKLLKLRDTFLNGHILGSEYNGRVYPRIHQTKGDDGGTGTGRFSYSDPALQQIPSRDKAIASVVRPIFLPDQGCEWVDGDLISFEVRVFAHLVNNAKIISEYRKNPKLDLHGYVAGETGLPRNKPPEGGANGKQLNLSMIFNTGRGAAADQMGLPWEWDSFLPKGKEDKPENYIHYKKPGPEAIEIIDRYHDRVPGVKELAEKCKQIAERNGRIKLKSSGRCMRFPRGWKTYKASGLAIQGTAADWNKRNWQLIREVLEGTGGRLLLNTHDSYGLSLPEGQSRELAQQCKDAIENEPRSRVPLIIEFNHPGVNWWESYNTEPWLS